MCGDNSCGDALATAATSRSTRDDQPWVDDWLGFVFRSRCGNDRLFRTRVARGKYVSGEELVTQP